MTEKLTSQQLKSFLWDAANILRGKIDSGDFKHYILGLLFYKRLSDVFDEEFDKMKDTVGEDLAMNPDLYGDNFFIPKGCHWNDILNTSTNKGEKINDVFVEVTRANSPRLDGILDKIDFNDKDRLSDTAVNSLVNHFNRHRLGKEISHAFTHYRRVAGLDDAFSFHTCRSTYVTMMFNLIGEEALILKHGKDIAIRHYLEQRQQAKKFSTIKMLSFEV